MRLALAIVLALLAYPAFGQEMTCDKRAAMLAHLASKYTEAPIAMGVTSAGALVEVLSSGDGKTWTIILSTPQGMSCLLASGEGWQSRKYAPGGPGV